MGRGGGTNHNVGSGEGETDAGGSDAEQCDADNRIRLENVDQFLPLVGRYVSVDADQFVAKVLCRRVDE